MGLCSRLRGVGASAVKIEIKGTNQLAFFFFYFYFFFLFFFFFLEVLQHAVNGLPPQLVSPLPEGPESSFRDELESDVRGDIQLDWSFPAVC